MLSSPMIESSAPQIGNLLQFLAWVAGRPRTYADTMEAGRTSCPRLSAQFGSEGAPINVINVETLKTPQTIGVR